MTEFKGGQREPLIGSAEFINSQEEPLIDGTAAVGIGVVGVFELMLAYVALRQGMGEAVTATAAFGSVSSLVVLARREEIEKWWITRRGIEEVGLGEE